MQITESPCEITQTSFLLSGFIAMELSDANLQTLTEYLKKTLDPDPAIRRPGKENKYCFLADLFLKDRQGEPLCNLFVNLKKKITLGFSDIVYISFSSCKVCGVILGYFFCLFVFE